VEETICKRTVKVAMSLNTGFAKEARNTFGWNIAIMHTVGSKRENNREDS
jgi:hypothetical protein